MCKIYIYCFHTRILIHKALLQLKKFFSSTLAQGKPDIYLLILLELTLLCNDFQFDKDIFLQTKGTATGKTHTPAFANIFMHCWEHKLFLSLIPLSCSRVFETVLTQLTQLSSTLELYQSQHQSPSHFQFFKHKLS